MNLSPLRTAVICLAALSATAASGQVTDPIIVSADTFYPPDNMGGFDNVWGRISAIAKNGPDPQYSLCWRPETENTYRKVNGDFGYRMQYSTKFRDFAVYQFLISWAGGPTQDTGIEFYSQASGSSTACDNTRAPTGHLKPNDAWLASYLDVTIFNTPQTRALMRPDKVPELFGTVVSRAPLPPDGQGNAFCLSYRNTSSVFSSYRWKLGTPSSDECFKLTAKTKSGVYVYKWETNNPWLNNQPGLEAGSGYAYRFNLTNNVVFDNAGFDFTGIEIGTPPTQRSH